MSWQAADLAVAAGRYELPKRLRGVYMLVDGGEVTYIGKSVDVASRLRQHASSNMTFTGVTVFQVPEEAPVSLESVERYLILVARPRLNRSRPALSPEESGSAKDWLCRQPILGLHSFLLARDDDLE